MTDPSNDPPFAPPQLHLDPPEPLQPHPPPSRSLEDIDRDMFQELHRPASPLGFSSSSPSKLDHNYNFKYFGMKWRFLKFYLQPETLPSIFNRSQRLQQINAECLKEENLMVESLEQGLLPDLGLSTSQYQPHNQSLHQYSSLDTNSLVNFSLDENSQVTTDEIALGIKNIKIFNDQKLQYRNADVAIRKGIKEAKPEMISFSPRPPSVPIHAQNSIATTTSTVLHIQPIDYSKGVLHAPKSAGNKFRKNRIKGKGSKEAQLAEQIQHLEISKHFKSYVIDNGLRVPECVKKVDIEPQTD